jgi:hypothetical protein
MVSRLAQLQREKEQVRAVVVAYLKAQSHVFLFRQNFNLPRTHQEAGSSQQDTERPSAEATKGTADVTQHNVTNVGGLNLVDMRNTKLKFS